MTTAVANAPEVLAPLMSEIEAREAVAGIKRSIGSLRAKLIELDEREGWRVLGYASMVECCEREFGWKRSHYYRMLDAAAVERALGVPIGDTKESHLRPLAGKPPEVQRQAFAEASKDGAPTAERVKRAVERIEQPTAIAPTGPAYAGWDQQDDVAPDPEPDPTESPLERSLRIAREIQALQQSDPEPRVTVTPASAATEPAVQELARLAAENWQPVDEDSWTVGEIDRVFFEKRGMGLADVLRVARAVVETAEDEEVGSNRRAAARAYLKRA